MRDLKDSLTATKEEQNVNRKAKKKAKESEKPMANATDESNMQLKEFYGFLDEFATTNFETIISCTDKNYVFDLNEILIETV